MLPPLISLSLYPSPSHLSPPNRLAIPLSTSVPNEYAFILTIIPLTNYQICSIQNVPPDVSVFLQYILLYLHHTFIPTIITYFHAFYIHSQAWNLIFVLLRFAKFVIACEQHGLCSANALGRWRTSTRTGRTVHATLHWNIRYILQLKQNLV